MRASVFLHARMHVLVYTSIYTYTLFLNVQVFMHARECMYKCAYEYVRVNEYVYKMCMHEWEGNECLCVCTYYISLLPYWYVVTQPYFDHQVLNTHSF